MISKTGKTSKKGTARKAKSANPDYVYEKLFEAHGPLDQVSIEHTLDLAIFSHLLLQMHLQDAVRAYNAFKAGFVDWNEVRISSAKEVQEVLKGAEEPLELALAIKGFLQRLFEGHHHVGLEFLRELGLAEIRTFFKKASSFAESTVHLVMERLKEYPVFPLEAWMIPCVDRLRLVAHGATPLQKQKDLYEIVPRERMLSFHAYLVEHARSVCVAEDELIDCPNCVLKYGCPYPSKRAARSRTAKKSK